LKLKTFQTNTSKTKYRRN